MLVRNEVLFKWTLYALAALLCLAVQGALLQRVTLWGVIPFLYPLAAVIPATFNAPAAGTAFALAVGVVCDLLLPGSLPCFYTLTFPLAGLGASLLSRSLLSAGVLCSLAAGAMAFFLTGSFHCLVLWAGGKAAWGAGAYLTLREFCVTAPLTVPMTVLFRAGAERTRLDE